MFDMSKRKRCERGFRLSVGLVSSLNFSWRFIWK